jgi:hypothetical protein
LTHGVAMPSSTRPASCCPSEEHTAFITSDCIEDPQL